MLNLMLNMISFLSENNSAVDPLYEGITLVGPYALGVIITLSLFYGIFLGVKYAKAQTVDEKANMQKTIVNFAIGAVVVIVLISVLYAIRGPLVSWINSGK